MRQPKQHARGPLPPPPRQKNLSEAAEPRSAGAQRARSKEKMLPVPMPTTTSELGRQFENAKVRACEVGEQCPAANHMKLSHECHIFTFQHETGQPPGRIGPRVDIDPVGANIRFHDRRVSVDDDLSETLLMQQEIFPYP